MGRAAQAPTEQTQTQTHKHRHTHTNSGPDTAAPDQVHGDGFYANTETDVFYENQWYHETRGTAGTEPGTTKTTKAASTKPLSATGTMARTFPTLAAQHIEAETICEHVFYANQWYHETRGTDRYSGTGTELPIDWLLMYCTFDAWCCVLARTADDIHYPLQRVSSLA